MKESSLFASIRLLLPALSEKLTLHWSRYLNMDAKQQKILLNSYLAIQLSLKDPFKRLAFNEDIEILDHDQSSIHE